MSRDKSYENFSNDRKVGKAQANLAPARISMESGSTFRDVTDVYVSD